MYIPILDMLFETQRDKMLHYENMPIQICTKFHLQKLKIFR